MAELRVSGVNRMNDTVTQAIDIANHAGQWVKDGITWTGDLLGTLAVKTCEVAKPILSYVVKQMKNCFVFIWQLSKPYLFAVLKSGKTILITYQRDIAGIAIGIFLTITIQIYLSYFNQDQKKTA